MSVAEGAWADRWRRLRMGGLSRDQTVMVWHVLDECSAFGSERMSQIAFAKLNDVYDYDLSDRTVVDGIHELLRHEWEADTLDRVAGLVMASGRGLPTEPVP